MKKTNTVRHRLNTAICITTGVLTLSTALANGFRLPEYSAAGVATSNALVADTSRSSAIAYNPAIMSLQTLAENKDVILSGSYINVQYETKVTTSTKTVQGTGEDAFDIPTGFIGTHLSDKLSIGLLFHSPFGLETQWPTTTFSPFLGITSLEPKLSRVKMYNANANLSYKIQDKTALSFGLNQYRLLDLQFNSQATIIEGSATGYGWNIGFITDLSDELTLGLSYRSKVSARATGTAAAVLPVQLDVTFPEMLTLGLNYSLSKNLKLELDIEHTGWHVFDNLNIVNSVSDAVVTNSTNNWKDTLTYRLSAQYKMNKHQFLFGYSLDETPQDDAKFSARIPDADRQLFSIGYQYDFGQFQLETGLMLVKFDSRTFNSNTTYVPAAGSESNGTTAYNGTYKADATVLSIGINTTF